MRLVCPYVHVTRETREALEGLDVEYIDVSSDDQAYWRLLAERWTPDDDLGICEHDIVPPAGFLDSFNACEHEWCCYAYPYKGWSEYAGLGCVRFRGSLIRAEPDLLREVGDMVIGGHDRKHYCTLDAGIQRWLGRYQRRAHVHGTCGHVSDGQPSHGCCG